MRQVKVSGDDFEAGGNGTGDSIKVKFELFFSGGCD